MTGIIKSINKDSVKIILPNRICTLSKGQLKEKPNKKYE